MTDHREQLKRIRTFPSLVKFLRDELDWPVDTDDFEEMTFDYEPEELGIDSANAAKIDEIKRLRPLAPNQPWGIFFVKFEPKQLPVVALRRILAGVVVKKRATASAAEQQKWVEDDLLFISNYGQGEERRISFAHFSKDPRKSDLPTLKVIAWDELDTPLHLDHTADLLVERLSWPADESEWGEEAWRERWGSAFELQHREVITTSKVLAERLAELARRIRAEILRVLEIETDDGKITRLMNSFRESLLGDLGAEGFADMYAQTIAYGLLSARIADPQGQTADDLAAHMRTNPFLRELLETFLHIGGRRGKAGESGIDFDELGVGDVVKLLDDANMEAVVRDFGDRNPLEDPVIHFYEHFLAEYDKQLRVKRGVFYTPQPVVSYIVRSAHELLQEEFGLGDGLADVTTWSEMLAKRPDLELPALTDDPEETQSISPNEPFVQIIDPATGTGTFLVEVIDVIHRTLVAKWTEQRLTAAQQSDAWNDYVPKHLLPRLHAYELMMAPYAITHLKVGLKLAETGYRFGSEERARIYLTNALEPWQKQLALPDFEALAHEAAAVNEIKRTKRFTVVLGNPPYSSVSQNMSGHLASLVNQYLHLPDGPMQERSNRNHLQDDYVKFLRVSQAAIRDTGIGLVAMITNSSYLTGAWYRGMRFHLQDCFSVIKILNLHGGKGFIRSPSEDDENVFDIMQSVSIGLFVASGSSDRVVQYDECIGSKEQKYDRLLNDTFSFATTLEPVVSNQWLFAPLSNELQPEWNDAVSVENIFSDWGAGVKTNRNGLAVGYSIAELESKIGDFGDLSQEDSAIESKYSFSSNYQWVTGNVRKQFALQGYDPLLVTKYLFRPFDERYIYWHPSIVFNMRGEKMEVFRSHNAPVALLFSRTTIKDDYTNFFVTRLIADHDCLEKTKVAALVSEPLPQQARLVVEDSPQVNLSPAFLERLTGRLELGGAGELRPNAVTADEVFHYIYAIFHSRRYRERYGEFLRIEFPRVPLTTSIVLFRALARLGGELTALHLMESPQINQPITEFFGSHKIERVGWSNDTVWLDAVRTDAREGHRAIVGGSAGFRGVPEEVWNFHIGGYQICHKWLKDRTGRTVSEDDIAHYGRIVVALAETIELMTAVDAVIEEHGGWPGAFADPCDQGQGGIDAP